MTLFRMGLLRGLMLGCTVALLPSGIRAEDSDAQLLSRLPKSKHTVQEALEAVHASGGVPISAKLEFEDGKLWLSAYGAKAGLDKCAEKNELFELKGDATTEKWQPEREVFQDKEHLTRASAQLTLMQTTQLTLDAAVAKADALKKGSVYSAIPMLKDGKTAINVRIRTTNGQGTTIVIDGKAQ
ncbi:MAG TPA: hypothetical protein VFK05_14155 [Polyangiaceae bacterium]|nr:hypothetical protein [Polyangiaceae bacterium]